MLAPVLSLHDVLSVIGQNQSGAPGQMRARISLKQRADGDISNAEERKALEMHEYIYMYTGIVSILENSLLSPRAKLLLQSS